MKSAQFVLDTNVLLSDPESIYAYPKARLIIPLAVIEEIDQFKKEYNERGRNARVISQMLDQIRLEGSLTEGVKLKNDAVLRVYFDVSKLSHSNYQKGSSRVLEAALELKRHTKEKLVLVTNDINMRVRASAMGIEAISYDETGKSPSQLYEALTKANLTPAQYKELIDKGSLFVPGDGYANQNRIFAQGEVSCLARYQQSKWRPVPSYQNGIWGLVPRNVEQQAALEFLMDESVHLVTLAGKAGTGKTLLALAAALELMMKVGHYQKILVSRPIFPMGRDMGYLPGDIDEKMAPWMQPIFDNLEFLFSGPEGHKAGSFERLHEKGLIELEPLTYIRGRSISRRIMIVDEAQNLTPHELKTIVTRVGEGTKIILTGDPYQIDNPYIDPNSNGLSYVIQKFRGQPLAAHVTLLQGVRSPLAELASNIL